MPMPTPAAAAQAWANGMAASGEKLKAGVNAVTESPTEKAAAAVDRYAAGVQRAVAENKFQNGLRRVSLQQWKDAMNGKGASRIAAGASAAKPKMQAFLEQFLPYEKALVDSLPARGDQETNIQRAVAVMRGNAAFRRQ